MKLSLVIPAHNEETCIEETVLAFHEKLKLEKIDHEIVVVNDNSSDETENILKRLHKQISNVRYVNNTPPNGFGFAVRKGLESYTGDCVAIVMADMSDRPVDLVKYYRELDKGYDCVFGSRFIRGGKVVDYPKNKIFLNRFTNTIIRLLFGIKYNDVTNAFKLYRREALDGLRPFLSHHFNLTVELPLKAIVRGYSYAVVPNHWLNRKSGESKLKIKEMGSRYFYIILYCLIEKLLSRGDYKKGKARPAVH
jgi:dolichol-phosphate mannosyltransferase